MTIQEWNTRLIEELQDKAAMVEPQASLLSTLDVINGRSTADHDRISLAIFRVERMMKLETVRAAIGRTLEIHNEAQLKEAWAIVHDLYREEHEEVEHDLDMLVKRR